MLPHHYPQSPLLFKQSKRVSPYGDSEEEQMNRQEGDVVNDKNPSPIIKGWTDEQTRFGSLLVFSFLVTGLFSFADKRTSKKENDLIWRKIPKTN